MEGESPPLSRGGLSPSKPPSLTENFPQEHPPVHGKDLFRFVRCGCSRGKFLSLGEVRTCCRVRLSRTFGRRVARNDTRVVPFWLKDNFYEECRFIPPHQSLTRQLPPDGKPSLRCANRANRTLNRGMSSRSALIRRLRRHLPPRRGRLWCVTFSSEFVFLGKYVPESLFCRI